MAKLEILAPFILSFEGGFSNHPLDKGGATNMGVTLKTWRRISCERKREGCERKREECEGKGEGWDKNGDGVVDEEDLKLLTEKDVVERVMRPYYWNVWKGDCLKSQSIANILVDWLWGSGKAGIVNVQKLLGTKADGIVGPQTLHAVNDAEPEPLFEQIKSIRRDYLYNLVSRHPEQKVFLRGWLRRLDSIGYRYLLYNGSSRKVLFADTCQTR